ncbi:MAG: EF-P lysine aminoacylase EpmA [Pseudomonadales bacterium]
MPRIDSTGACPFTLCPNDARQLLVRRAGILNAIRHYFYRGDVLEVTTPQLGRYPVSDPQLQNFIVDNPLAAAGSADKFYLQTSPESAMKQLLSKGSGSIYQLCQVFRVDPPGALHAMEFTMLEWYRLGFGFDGIIQDTLALVAELLAPRPQKVVGYREIFLQVLDIDPFNVTPEALRRAARTRVDASFDDADDAVWLDLLFSHCIAPQLGRDCFTVVRDFPPAQAAMAALHNDEAGNSVAARFEMFIDGVEIANGYRELTDWREQQARFANDNRLRACRGIMQVPVDDELLQAMRERGLPECAGVALGVDRLLMFAE